MLSGVLNSETAIRVHIQIIRVFAKMKELLLTHKDILLQLEKIEKKLSKHDEDIQLIFQYLKQLLNPTQPPRRKIGFRLATNKKNSKGKKSLTVIDPKVGNYGKHPFFVKKANEARAILKVKGFPKKLAKAK